jgi:Ni,Fe-hydrogenase III small subunit
MLAGGLFLFATSVPSSQRTRVNKLLQLAEEALRSDPTVVMELGPGIESGNVYASAYASFESVDQIVLQFQINGGNAWAQGITYGVEDENGLRLVALEVANMDAVLSNQSFQVPLNL